ncbi:MAG: L,D-transpeptidase family protein [Chitinophagaceae bacterium]
MDEKIIDKSSHMNAAVNVQMKELLQSLSDTTKFDSLGLYNKQSLNAYLQTEHELVFTNKKSFTNSASKLKTFIDTTCKFYGLFPKAYHQEQLTALQNQLESDAIEKSNAVQWAKAELLMTDAFFQLIKHIRNGQLYKDSSNVYYDSTLTNQYLVPNLQQFNENPEELDSLLALLEPQFPDYDSLKMYLKNILENQVAFESNSFTKLSYPIKDSVQFLKQFIQRIQEEGLSMGNVQDIDSIQLKNLIKSYQQKHHYKEDGIWSKELIENMNATGNSNFVKIAISLDRFRQLSIPHEGQYVLVNIPSFALRAYNQDQVAVESKVVVGRVGTKTPIMESEISDIIIMPQWFVPPSILRLPGYIERKRRNPNYIVRGKSVIQKSGPGNALGKCKFNFESSDAIYLHDTNEKWAFGASKRALSHGCVRVQSYEALANFLSSMTPLVEKNYKKVKDKIKKISSSGDTSYTYKYVVKDSLVHNQDAVSDMFHHSGHHELELSKKIPVYITYMTCAVRNGMLVHYADVYAYDSQLQKNYIEPYL